MDKPKPDPVPGLLLAARMAKRAPAKSGYDSYSVLFRAGYERACKDIAAECSRRAREGK